MRLTQIIEALLFASDAPLSALDLSRVDERLDEDTVEAVIQELRAEYELSERSFQIYEVAGGYQLLTRPEFVSVLERYDSVPQPARLSAPALEVLAIIAYRQPIGRVEVEDIRGVGSSGVLRTLTERNLVEPVARGEGLGRPLLYGTTKKFLEHFGFRSLEDLPRPDELPVVLREQRPQQTLLPLEDEDAAATEGAPAGEPAAADSAAVPAQEQSAESAAAGAEFSSAAAESAAAPAQEQPDERAAAGTEVASAATASAAAPAEEQPHTSDAAVAEPPAAGEDATREEHVAGSRGAAPAGPVADGAAEEPAGSTAGDATVEDTAGDAVEEAATAGSGGTERND